MQNLIDKINMAKVLLIGDIMLDRFIYGAVNRISPEGPIPVLAIEKETQMLGGAGNVLANILGLGAKADIISIIGDDEAGTTIKQIITSQGGNPDNLIIDTNIPTILKTRYIAQNQQLLRVDHEKIKTLDAEIEKEILSRAQKLMSGVNILVISDYNKGVISESLATSLVAMAKENNVTVIVDTKETDLTRFKGADIITPNKKELCALTNNTSLPLDTNVEDAANGLLEQYDLNAVIATRSEEGITVVEKDKPAIHLPTQASEVYDVSGAGDTVVATIAAILGAGGDLKQAAQLSNVSAGLVVAKIGTAIITKQELEAALQKQNTTSFISPILEWDGAAKQIKEWQAQGLTVGMTGGCFDIIHYGHVNYLARAREKCDCLIMALNHDKSVKILKGPTRPINDEKARANVMAALGSVDMVVFFGAEEADDDNTPVGIVTALKPDVFFKGGDYTIDQMPEGQAVINYGGKVDIMPLYEGYSTSNIIQKSQKDK